MQGVLVPPRPQLNIRLDPRTAAILAALMKGLNLNTTGVIRLALLRLAEREGVPVPDDGE
jgi:antitoxin component of RelBE/YafQ-DinJ toxin-antitoxin module